MRSTAAPSAVTAASAVNRPIMTGAKANSRAPDTAIMPTSRISSICARSRMRALSFAPRAFPASVAAAVIMP